MTLHITNGHATSIAETDLGGEVVYWQDVLHEGPVPRDLSLEALSSVRAEFIASRGWADRALALADFVARDAAVRAASEHDEVVLWFEYDVYDQLQLLQALDSLRGLAATGTPVLLICLRDHPDIEDFRGLGQLKPDQLTALFPERQPVSPAAWDLAQVAWHAFRDDTPLALDEIGAAPDTGALPLLGPALRRLLIQYPGPDGLSGTERLVLFQLAESPATLARLFRRTTEEDPMLGLGDSVFLTEYVLPMSSEPDPLIQRKGGTAIDTPKLPPNRDFWQQSIEITPLGREVLAGVKDACSVRPLDRWIGGVHLTGPAPSWRWNPQAGRIVAT